MASVGMDDDDGDGDGAVVKRMLEPATGWRSGELAADVETTHPIGGGCRMRVLRTGAGEVVRVSSAAALFAGGGRWVRVRVRVMATGGFGR